MIQDIQPLSLDNQFKSRKVTENDSIIAFSGKNILIREKEGFVECPSFGEICSICSAENLAEPQAIYVFSIGEKHYYLLDGQQPIPEPKGETLGDLKYISMMELRLKKPKEMVFAGATAWHLSVWYRNNRFCGVCGGRMIHDEKERMVRCEDCGAMVFPKIMPAVIVGVTDGDKLLVTKYVNREYKRYALIAGFVEIGETVEETVRREVKEEVGIDVRNITYYKSQPWGFDCDLLMGFFCEADSSDKIKLDKDELAVAEWISYDEVPDYKDGLSLTHEMMSTFREKMQNKA